MFKAEIWQYEPACWFARYAGDQRSFGSRAEAVEWLRREYGASL